MNYLATVSGTACLADTCIVAITIVRHASKQTPKTVAFQDEKEVMRILNSKYQAWQKHWQVGEQAVR